MKRHWGDREPGDLLYVTLCGHMAPEVAPTPQDVTCKRCQKRIEQGVTDARLRAYAAVELASQYPQPMPSRAPSAPERPLPPLVMPQPRLHLQRYARCPCGMCESCLHFNQIEADYAGRLRRVAHRTKGARYRFGNVRLALEWYFDLIEDDGLRRYGSPLGTMGERVQGRVSELAPLERIAWYSAGVQAGLDLCYRLPSKRGLTRADRLAILYACEVGPREKTKRGAIQRQPMDKHKVAETMGHGLDASSVGEIGQEGVETVYRALRVRELVG